jgi:hypothetical protein
MTETSGTKRPAAFPVNGQPRGYVYWFCFNPECLVIPETVYCEMCQKTVHTASDREPCPVHKCFTPPRERGWWCPKCKANANIESEYVVCRSWLSLVEHPWVTILRRKLKEDGLEADRLDAKMNRMFKRFPFLRDRPDQADSSDG